MVKNKCPKCRGNLYEVGSMWKCHSCSYQSIQTDIPGALKRKEVKEGKDILCHVCGTRQKSVTLDGKSKYIVHKPGCRITWTNTDTAH